jgi:hypothetical protein
MQQLIDCAAGQSIEAIQLHDAQKIQYHSGCIRAIAESGLPGHKLKC